MCLWSSAVFRRHLSHVVDFSSNLLSRLLSLSAGPVVLRLVEFYLQSCEIFVRVFQTAVQCFGMIRRLQTRGSITQTGLHVSLVPGGFVFKNFSSVA